MGARLSRLALASASIVLLMLASGAPARGFVYWADQTQGTIGRANLDGSGFDPDFIPLPGAGEPVPIGVAVTKSHVYWTSTASKDPETGKTIPATISRANLDGTGETQSFIQGNIGPEPSWVATNGESLYWASDDAIYRANLDGTDAKQLIPHSFGDGGVKDLAVSSTHIYWSRLTGESAIGQANLDGSEPDPEFLTGLGQVQGIAVDSNHLYWSAWPDRIGQANLDGSERDDDFFDKADGEVGQIAADDEHIFWTVRNNSPLTSIGRVGIDGLNPNPFQIAPLSFVGEIAVDAGYSPEPAPLPGATKTPRPPSNRFWVGRLLLHRHTPIATLMVGVPGPGQIKLWGSGLKPATVHPPARKRVAIPVVLRGIARERLRHRGRSLVLANIVFAPTDGTPRTRRMRLKLSTR